MFWGESDVFCCSVATIPLDEWFRPTKISPHKLHSMLRLNNNWRTGSFPHNVALVAFVLNGMFLPFTVPFVRCLALFWYANHMALGRELRPFPPTMYTQAVNVVPFTRVWTALAVYVSGPPATVDQSTEATACIGATSLYLEGSRDMSAQYVFG